MTGKEPLKNLGNLMHNDEGILPIEEGKLCMFFMFKSFSVALLLTASLVGSVYGIHFLVHADSTSSAVTAAEGRPEARGLAQVDFVKAGSCALTNTPYNLLDFDDYGCYCGTSFSGGVAGIGEPVDSIDRCCMDYDKRIREIVGDNTLQGLGSLIAVPYDVDCDTSSSPFPQPKCSDADDPMSKAICESDKELFTCWRANLPSYSLFNLNMSSPGQDSCGPRDRNDPIADVLRLVRMAHGAKAAFTQARAIGGEVSRQATSVLQTLTEKVYDPNPQIMLEKLAVELEENEEILPPKLRAQFDSFMGMPEFQIFTQQVLPATKSFMDSVRDLGSALGRVDLSKNFAEVKALAEEAGFTLQNRKVSAAGMEPEPDLEPSE